ncbi:MAG: ATP-dependent helicase [Hyphomonadaceae bacterium]
MSPEVSAAIGALSPTQQDSVNWGEGPALVLAGPGVGKTTVLTARIARLLDESQDKNFKILALTFTTKAGDEMRSRVEALVPSLVDRTVIGTFHSFSAQVLRQHGSHLGIKPDFGIYDQDSDRRDLLRDALRTAQQDGLAVSPDDVRLLHTIDRLRSNLVSPEKAPNRFRDARAGQHVGLVYKVYEDALRKGNVTDFNGMILDTCRLAHKMPSVAARIRQAHRYWMIDEFQDTTPAQYRMMKFLAGDQFKNVFVVADDDQIIYQWAGASYQQILRFREEFSPVLMQLVENRRCPLPVVVAANNVISHNSDRTPGKAPLVATLDGDEATIRYVRFPNSEAEALGIAADIARLDKHARGKAAVLARTRATLTPVLAALKEAGIPASIVTRRDRFVSAQFVWLQSALELALRPTDRQMLLALVAAGNRIADVEIDGAIIAAEADASGASYLESWALEAATKPGHAAQLSSIALKLVQTRASWSNIIADSLDWLVSTAEAPDDAVSDADEDKAAWEQAVRAIRIEKGGKPELDELLQGMALRPKEPPLDPNSVRLFTIHSAKGLEFDHVWLAGAAESILPSWQSLKPDASPSELEEERRNFFVAITRTRNSLTITNAATYGGWNKAPSRFIAEMNLNAAVP